MFYKVSPFGYFGRVTKVSRGPWFRELWVEEDGLEYFYVYNNGEGITYLLTNNIPVEDREKLQRLYMYMYSIFEPTLHVCGRMTARRRA